MNQITLLGRVVAEVQTSIGNDGKTYARFRLAVNRSKTEADFFNCACVDSLALNAEKYLAKGKRVLVSGTARTGFYQNKDGVKVPSFTVFVSKLDFIDYADNGNSEEHFSNDNSTDYFDFELTPEELEVLPFK